MSRRRLLFLGLSGGTGDDSGDSGDSGGTDPEIDPGDTSIYGRAGDVVVYNDSESRLMLIPFGDEIDSTWIPIGIVVVPGHHDIYENGCCGVISCYTINSGYLNNPYWGTTSQSYGGGCPKGVLTNLFGNYTTCAGTTAALAASYSKAYDMLYNSANGPSGVIATFKNSSTDIFSCYGRTKHDALVEYADGKNATWRTLNSIVNLAPALPISAMACERFVTDGTEQGDWYWGDFIENLYLTANVSKYNSSINAIESAGHAYTNGYNFGIYNTGCPTVYKNLLLVISTSGFINFSQTISYSPTGTYKTYTTPFAQMSFDKYY